MENVFVKKLDSCDNGLIIRIAGEVPEDARWFAINLQNGTVMHPRSDIVLHISPRFDGAFFRVVRNSLVNERWGNEETAGHFPFKLGEQFEVLILVEHEGYKIAVNGEHYAEYRHRLPFATVNAIVIDGDVTLYAVETQAVLKTVPSAPVEDHYADSSTTATAHPGLPGSVPPAAPPPYPVPSFTPPYPIPHGYPVPQARWACGLGNQAPVPPYPPYPVSIPRTNENPQFEADSASPMPIPENSPIPRKRLSLFKAAGIGAAAGLGAYALGQLTYPGIANFGEHILEARGAHQCDEEHTKWGSSDSDSSEED
ncbi:Gal-bind lectin domain containing protein [Trichuris trichiura]|uniref:Galectin n=1 Tax=Trichuris trichiura TaxID=36087 RepID=A0A077ZBA2_TRITR|nr:Gal-bind lectin domain containing protein [Trichuris trichiura]